MGKVFKALNKSLTNEQNFDNAQGEALADANIAAAPAPPGETPKPPPSQRNAGQPAGHSHEALASVAGWDEKLAVFSAPSSPLAENFRLLRTQILYPPSGRPCKKILVTSTVPGSGKSFVCANLGISLAQGLEQHALLVDCDLRRSRLASLFGCPSTKGLVNYLLEEEDLSHLIVKTGMRKLSIIPSGPRPSNPAELLGSAKVERMFAELSNRYDDRFIIIDTPPTQAASETAVLAKHADGVILVVRWGAGSREPIKQLADTLDKDKIIGVVFNAYETHMLSARVAGYDEYGQYAGGYGTE